MFVSLVEVFSFLFVFVFYCTFHACFLTVAIAYCMSTLPASANKKALVGFGTATIQADVPQTRGSLNK